MKICVLIPARGGSKGLVRKNMKMLVGLPLVSWPILFAKESEFDLDITVTTDCPEIAGVARDFGASVPVLRPSELSGDLATTEVALRFALEALEEQNGIVYDYFVFMTCTDICRPANLLDNVIKQALDDQAMDSIFAARATHKNFWHATNNDNSAKLERVLPWMAEYSNRQIRQPIFREDTGVCCITKAVFLRQYGDRLGRNCSHVAYDFPWDIDIHTEHDLLLAEQGLRRLINSNDESVRIYKKHGSVYGS